MAAAAERADAIDRIFELKGRPGSKALQLLVADESEIDVYGRPSPEARRLASSFWPGPLTIIVGAAARAPSAVTSEGTVGLRVPDHEIALEIIRGAGPLASTSANRSGGPTPDHLAGIRSLFGDAIDAYVDGGKIGTRPSTVVDMTRKHPVIVREGVISAEQIMHAAGFGFESG